MRSARAIAAFIELCSMPNSPVKTNPSDKLVKNLCTFLCQDESRTPIFARGKSVKRGILTLVHNPARGEATKESKDMIVETDAVKSARLVYRGAQMALSQLAATFGDDLLDKVPKLWSCMTEALLTTLGSSMPGRGTWVRFARLIPLSLQATLRRRMH